jgi:hypothetical protein
MTDLGGISARPLLTNMKQILKTNEPDFNVGLLKSRPFLFDNGNLYSCDSTEPSQARRTFMQRAPKAVKLIRRIIVSWVADPPFQPKLHSAVPIYPCVLNSRIKRRMIRRHGNF